LLFTPIETDVKLVFRIELSLSLDFNDGAPETLWFQVIYSQRHCANTK
jgi:hypothetical protein